MKRTRLAAVTGAAALAVAGLAGGSVIAACSSPGPGSSAASTASATSAAGGYSWYHSMMGTRYPGQSGSMMGGTSYGWMMGSSGYRWMTGGRGAPAWMRGTRCRAS